MPPVQHLDVSDAESGQKLLQFLQRRLGNVPRSLLMRLVRKGQVRVDGGRKKPFDRVSAGQVVRVPPIRLDDAPAPSVAGPALPVAYDEGGVLVIVKPAGLPVQPGTGHADAVTERLKAQYAGAAFTPTPAHRLDRDTSGLLACGATYAALRHLQEAFQSHTLGKYYLCWTEGACKAGTRLTMRDTMERSGAPGREKVRTGSGKDAHARALSLYTDGAATLFCVRLFTGRTHQIRVQLAGRGYPLVGDGKYGTSRGNQRMLLHAWALAWDETFVRRDPDWAGRFAVGGHVPDDVRELDM
ncbi:RluA family pseudouridine synthase [Desulfobaculum sp.]